MKNKLLVIVWLLFFACTANAQRIDQQAIFIATTEKEVYELYNQMLDSAKVSNKFIHLGGPFQGFMFGPFEEIESTDTLMKFVQLCYDDICKRSYKTYLSNRMPLDFYERFLNYLKQSDIIDNFYLKTYINSPLTPVLRIIIKQYESGELSKQDSEKAQRLIEETLLRLINDNYNYRILFAYDKYVTKNVHRALVKVIDNPFYPTEYLVFYMKHQDTVSLDTTGIPAYVRKKNRRELTDDEWVYVRRLDYYSMYERIGKEEYNGLSAGQAYLQKKIDRFIEKGYLPIKHIEEYAYKKQDKVLIKHLKKFKKKYPDYPLKYF